MNNLRFSSLEELIENPVFSKVNSIDHIGLNRSKITDYFACNVFTGKIMQEYLTVEAYESLCSSVKSGSKIDRKIASQIASGMRAWAIDKGVSHYTHWFQPLTGTTAEKHDAFFSIGDDGTPIENFDGNALIQQEPDASSLPNGGLRTTFEARGYTAWDPSSPAFIMDLGLGRTLCIPTAFVSYTGESLDFKTPLLRSIDVLDKAATSVCNYFDENINNVIATLGWEQEYFLVDAKLANARPDIMQCGRTVVGHPPAKGQQLEDHYFGAIPNRAYAFMRDLEIECYKLGIPLKTRHNEVAPAQFECAPIYEEVNIAVDHNLLLMGIMEKVAQRHDLKILLHEKPYAGINGSGKHNNWSLRTDTGVNLLKPGTTPNNNIMFLTFFVNTIKAVHDHADMLRASIASAGNDYRLGAHEAPPAIVSIFVGRYLSAVLDEIESRVGHKFDKQDECILKMDLHERIPELFKDNTDRNRTSPFAFTGNKFEFRAVGSSANSASAMITLNTIVADALIKFKIKVDELIAKGETKEIAILKILQNSISSSKNIRFEGDGYSSEWVKEAKRRGLSNKMTTPDALEVFNSTKTIAVFSAMKVLTPPELKARYEILQEDYIKRVQIEARVLGDLCINNIIPAAISYQNKLINNIKGLQKLGFEEKDWRIQKRMVENISTHILAIGQGVEDMINIRKRVNKIQDLREKTFAYCDEVKACFDPIRYHCDKLEFLIDDTAWRLPKYRELLLLS